MAIRVQLPDVDSATSLTQELFSPFRAELVQLDGEWLVEVRDGAHRATPHVLSAVERWLALSGLDEVTIHLEDGAHTLRGPVAG